MPAPPNILVFLTDDHGHWAGGFAGNPEIHSPSMDFIGETGARFANAFTPCPVCSPARASFWTGRIPSAHGIHDHIGRRDHPGIDGQTTLAMRLRERGYRTGLCGKWHAHAHGDKPQPGFDFWFSQWGGTAAKFGPQPFSDNGVRRDFHGHQEPLVTDAALRFLRAPNPSEAPFFLFVGYTDTHSPLETLPERLVRKYRGMALDSVAREPYAPAHGTPARKAPDDPEAFREQLAHYFASVEMIDTGVGRILDELEGQGRLDNTLIVYTSDHGHMNGQHGLLYKGNATTPQNFLEESIRVPLLVRRPGLVQAGRTHTLPVDHCDLHATLLDAAGIQPPAEPGCPGQSCLPVLRGEEIPDWRALQFCEYGNARMVRSADGFKLIRRYPGPNGHFPDEFYDLNTDPRETVNAIRAAEHRKRIAELDDALLAFFNQHQQPGCESTGVGERPPVNSDEPWRRTAEP